MGLVGCCKAIQYLCKDADSIMDAEIFADIHFLAQGYPMDKFHDQKASAFIHPCVIYGDNMRIRDRCG